MLPTLETQTDVQAPFLSSGAAMTTSSSVFLIDSDRVFRDGMSALFKTHGIPVVCFGSAEEFLACAGQEHTGCIILDVKMPGMSGSELQDTLMTLGIPLPIIFLAECVDIPTIVRAMKHGAYDFMVKPVDMDRLLEQVHNALKRSCELWDLQRQSEALCSRISTLTERERAILSLAISGASNKDISRRLGISHRTVEAHRSHILIKLGVDNFLELTHAFIAIDKFMRVPTAPAVASPLDFLL